MKTNPPVVHCIFAENAPSLSTLVQSSFRLYLKHTLTTQDTICPGAAPFDSVNKDVP